MLFCKTVLACTLAVPTAWAVLIETHFATETAITCSTSYGKTSISNVPTSTAQPTTTELSPVILHNSTTLTRTIVPNPFVTYFSHLETKTAWVTSTPRDGTFDTTSTKFATSTYWHHTSTTVTETKYRYLTSRTTFWIPTRTNFLPIRDTTSGHLPDIASKREIRHPHAIRDQSKKPAVRRPTSGSWPAEVNCKQEIQLHTTEVLFLTDSKRATVTLPQETEYKDKTVWGTITSTALSLPSLTGRDEVTTVPLTEASSQAPAPTTNPSLPTGPNGIATNLKTVTSTPYTITFTYTATSTQTTTSTRHATSTVTRHAACATANILAQTSRTQRINGITSPSFPHQLQKTQTKDPSQCCETCMQTQTCAWSIWEAEGPEAGACYLVLTLGEGVCDVQRETGAYGFSGGNGEVRYVASNGLCGVLGEA